MPNHCMNELLIVAKTEERLNEIRGEIESEECPLFDFSRIVPEPEYEEDSGDVMPQWWTWRNAYWGTKWNAYDAEMVEDEAFSVRLSFTTAWGPPLPVIAAFAAKYPDTAIALQYEEPGMGFAGDLHYVAGVQRVAIERDSVPNLRWCSDDYFYELQEEEE